MSCETFLTGRGDDDNYMGDEKLNRQEKRDDLIRKIQVLMEQNSGIVKTSQLYTLGMDYRKIQSFVEDGVLEKVKNGYYAVNFYKKREEDLVAALFSDGVLTMESALWCYHYIRNKPFKWTIAVDKNTSKSRFKMDYPLVQPYYTEPEVLHLGVEVIPFGSVEMKIYGKERLICDILKYENRMERDVLRQALQVFLEDQEKDIAKLLTYAKERRVLSKVRNQIGVWL